MTCVSVFSSAPVAAAGLGAIIGGIEGLRVTGICSRLESLEEQVRAAPPDLLLLEVNSGLTLDTIRRVLAAAPATAIILWVGAVPAEFLSQSLDMGVRGLLGRNSSVDLHRECLLEVAAGRMWVDREVSRRLLWIDKIALTQRERQLMGLLAKGLRNKEIAWSLGITEGTVKVYMSRLFVKVGAGDRFELALLALKNVVNGSGAAQAPTPAGGRAVPLPIPRYVIRERGETVRSEQHHAGAGVAAGEM